MHCKICKHNFNTGESYVQIGDIAVCADCSFKITVRDLAARGVFPVITMDDGAIPVDFVVDGESGLETHSEDFVQSELHEHLPEEIPVDATKEELNAVYGMNATPEEILNVPDVSPLVVLFTNMSGRKGYYIFANATDFRKNKKAKLNKMDIRFTTMEEIPVDYEFELDYRDNNEVN